MAAVQEGKSLSSKATATIAVAPPSRSVAPALGTCTIVF